jgi:hypothetical protein
MMIGMLIVLIISFSYVTFKFLLSIDWNSRPKPKPPQEPFNCWLNPAISKTKNYTFTRVPNLRLSGVGVFHVEESETAQDVVVYVTVQSDVFTANLDVEVTFAMDVQTLLVQTKEPTNQRALSGDCRYLQTTVVVPKQLAFVSIEANKSSYSISIYGESIAIQNVRSLSNITISNFSGLTRILSSTVKRIDVTYTVFMMLNAVQANTIRINSRSFVIASQVQANDITATSHDFSLCNVVEVPSIFQR